MADLVKMAPGSRMHISNRSRRRMVMFLQHPDGLRWSYHCANRKPGLAEYGDVCVLPGGIPDLWPPEIGVKR